MSTAREPLYTPAEYLERERAAEAKSELINGRIYAMAGASPIHNRIASNLAGLLWSHLRSTPCQPYGSDQRVAVSATEMYSYPDLSIACAPEEFDTERGDTLLNPTIIIEILSPSTEAHDRGAKFAHYRRLKSLSEYWLVSTERACVERFSRQGEEWLFQEYQGVDAAVPLLLAGVSLPLEEIYARVEFASVSPRSSE